MKISTTDVVMGEAPLCPLRFAHQEPCIGEACAAWRWSRGKETNAYLTAVKGFMAQGVEQKKALAKAFAEHPNPDDYAHTEGYCGLGGKLE